LIAFDTNVLVRYFAQDDREQGACANRLVEARTRDDPGFVSTIVLVELCWVLSRRYGKSATDILAILDSMLLTDALKLEGASDVRQAIRLAERTGSDFPDALIAVRATAEGCDGVYTFDVHAIRAGFMRAADLA
jgi:predicted nucleic-acid-binding protein